MGLACPGPENDTTPVDPVSRNGPARTPRGQPNHDSALTGGSWAPASTRPAELERLVQLGGQDAGRFPVKTDFCAGVGTSSPEPGPSPRSGCSGRAGGQVAPGAIDVVDSGSLNAGHAARSRGLDGVASVVKSSWGRGRASGPDMSSHRGSGPTPTGPGRWSSAVPPTTGPDSGSGAWSVLRRVLRALGRGDDWTVRMDQRLGAEVDRGRVERSARGRCRAGLGPLALGQSGRPSRWRAGHRTSPASRWGRTAS